MNRQAYNTIISILLVTLAFIISGCGGSGSQQVASSGQGSIAAKIIWDGVKTTAKSVASAPTGVTKVSLAISGPGMTTMQAEFPAASGSGTITGVPIGSGISVTASGIDTAGSIIYQGTVGNVSVQDGQTSDVNITAWSRTPSPGTLTGIMVTSPISILTVGTTQQLTATGSYTDNTTQVINGSVTWSSSAPNIATVGTTGLVTPLAVGTVTITARSGSIFGTLTISVLQSQKQLISIRITPANPSINLNSSATATGDVTILIINKTAQASAINTQQFTMTGYYSDGTTQDLTSLFTWSSSNTSVATITSSGGLATAVSVGTTTIKATYQNLVDSTTLTVVSSLTLPTTPISRTTGTPIGDTTITIAPVANSIGYYLYISKYLNGVLSVAPTAYNTAGTKRVMTASTVNLNANAASGGADFDSASGSKSAFAALGTIGTTGFYEGINSISYRVKVVYLNSDKIEFAQNTSADYIIDDKTSPQVSAVKIADATGSFSIDVPVAGVNPTTGRAATGTASGLVPAGTTITPSLSSPSGAAAGPVTFSGFFSAVASGSSNNVFRARIFFNEQMNKLTVENPNSWGITDTSNVGASIFTGISAVTGASTNGAAYAGNCVGSNCLAAVSVTLLSVIYDTTSQSAYVTYNINWTFTQPTTENLALTNVGFGTVYNIGIPNFYFTFVGSDLNNNQLRYSNIKKGF